MLLVIGVWGSTFPITRLVDRSVPPFWFALWRFVVASCVLLFCCTTRWRKIRMARDFPWLRIFLLGLIGVTLYYTVFTWSLVYTTASTGALIQGFIPVCIVVMARLFLGERIGVVKGIGIAVSVAGVLLLVWGSASDPGSAHPLRGNILMVSSVLLWSGYTIMLKRMQKIDPLLLTTSLTVAGTILLVPLTLLASPHFSFRTVPVSSWVAIIYLGAVASALCYLAYSYCIRVLPTTLIGNFLNLDPAIGAILSLLLLREQISPAQGVGIGMILIGIWMTTGRKASALAPS